MSLSIITAIIFMSTYGYGLEFLGFVIFGNLLGWFYSAPPLRLSYNSLGEPANMITMGLLMPGIGFWVINGGINGSFLLFSIPLFLYGLQFILTVELPDYESDKFAGKQTLVVRKGRKYGLLLIALSTLSATIFYIIYALSQPLSTEINPYFLTFFSIIPLIIAIIGLQVNIKNKVSIQRIATTNMASLIGFVLLLNFYFVFLLL
jgi:1,4-dihydroxy-2-naphthoate octaprenyltransferase